MNALAELAGSVVRNDERIHDVTARVESVVEPTSTRLFVIYKLNSAFSGSGPDAVTPSAGVRFDVQVNQALPLDDAEKKIRRFLRRRHARFKTQE